MQTYPIDKIEVVVVLGDVILPLLSLTNCAGRGCAGGDHRIILRIETLDVCWIGYTPAQRWDVHPADVARAVLITDSIVVVWALLD